MSAKSFRVVRCSTVVHRALTPYYIERFVNTRLFNLSINTIDSKCKNAYCFEMSATLINGNPGDIVAVWQVKLADGDHNVVLEHGGTSGKRVIFVDGQEVNYLSV